MKPASVAVIALVALAVGLFAGRLTAPPPSASPAAPPVGQSTPPGALPPSHPPLEAQDPSGAPVGGPALVGTVAEVIQVPNYTYLRLSTPGGEAWAAVSTNTEVKVGMAARILNGNEMAGFTSKTLNRTFDSIYFGQLELGASAAPATGSDPQSRSFFAAPGSGGTGGAMQAIAAADGPLVLRVADIITERQALKGRPVRVRGVVLKATAVGGSHILHVRDGSGSAEAKTDDLVVVTGRAVKPDDIVTVQGTVAVDRDLGSGGVYPVVVEGAQVVDE